jgi:hypothetical protein
MTALPGGESIKFVEQHAGIDAVAVEEVIVDTDQDPCLDRDRQLDCLTRPQIADNILLFAEEVAPVDR